MNEAQEHRENSVVGFSAERFNRLGGDLDRVKRRLETLRIQIAGAKANGYPFSGERGARLDTLLQSVIAGCTEVSECLVQQVPNEEASIRLTALYQQVDTICGSIDEEIVPYRLPPAAPASRAA
jgi:hypothetical protein